MGGAPGQFAAPTEDWAWELMHSRAWELWIAQAVWNGDVWEEGPLKQYVASEE